MKDDQSSEWKKRRIVKKEKSYECGCGRKYKLLNSLQTHIKQSHDGVPPGPIKIPQKSNRGRPKQNQYRNISQLHQIKQNPLKQLQGIKEINCPADLDLKDIYQNEPVYKLMNRFVKQKQLEELKFDEQDKIYQVNLGRGLVILIQDMVQIVQDQIFKNELILFITIYVSYIIEEAEDQNVLSNGCIGLLPDFVNFFIMYEFQKRCAKLKIQGLWINGIKNVIDTFTYIFRWLNFRKFANAQVTANQDYINPVDDIPQQQKQNQE